MEQLRKIDRGIEREDRMAEIDKKFVIEVLNNYLEIDYKKDICEDCKIKQEYVIREDSNIECKGCLDMLIKKDIIFS